jgi:hypothetical protein
MERRGEREFILPWYPLPNQVASIKVSSFLVHTGDSSRLAAGFAFSFAHVTTTKGKVRGASDL